MVRLRLSTIVPAGETGELEIDRQFNALKALLPDVLVTDRDEPMEAVVARLLLDRGQTLGTAESCTGGFIAQLITAMAGSSRYYKGSVVSYANEIKERVLQVSPETLEKEGAVSEATVIQMVKGALEALQTDYAIAVSGIMGPDGGSQEKPVGTVWVAVGNSREIITQKFKFRFDRRRNIDLTAINALNLCRKFILDQTVSTKN